MGDGQATTGETLCGGVRHSARRDDGAPVPRDDSEGAEVIVLKVAGDPKVGRGAMLKLEGLVALPWSIGERSGVAFRASRIESVGVAPGAVGQRQSEKAAA